MPVTVAAPLDWLLHEGRAICFAHHPLPGPATQPGTEWALVPSIILPLQPSPAPSADWERGKIASQARNPQAAGRFTKGRGAPHPTSTLPSEGNAKRDCFARLSRRRRRRRWEGKQPRPSAKERSPQPPRREAPIPPPAPLQHPRRRTQSTRQRLGPWPTPPRASAQGGWSDLAPSANKSSGHLVRSPARLAIGRHPSLGPPNLCDPSQSRGSEATPLPALYEPATGAGGHWAGGGDRRREPVPPPPRGAPSASPWSPPCRWPCARCSSCSGSA